MDIFYVLYCTVSISNASKFGTVYFQTLFLSEVKIVQKFLQVMLVFRLCQTIIAFSHLPLSWPSFALSIFLIDCVSCNAGLTFLAVQTKRKARKISRREWKTRKRKKGKNRKGERKKRKEEKEKKKKKKGEKKRRRRKGIVMIKSYGRNTRYRCGMLVKKMTYLE